MIKDFICTGCNKGPCIKREDEVREVWSDYYKSTYHSSDWWSTYDFRGTRQCMDVINQREKIFQCERCGHFFEDYMLHTLTDDVGYEWRFCPDCYERYIKALDSIDDSN